MKNSVVKKVVGTVVVKAFAFALLFMATAHNASAQNAQYIYCALQDNIHSTAYFSDVFAGDYSQQLGYSVAFTNFVHGNYPNAIGVASCFLAMIPASLAPVKTACARTLVWYIGSSSTPNGFTSPLRPGAAVLFDPMNKSSPLPTIYASKAQIVLPLAVRSSVVGHTSVMSPIFCALAWESSVTIAKNGNNGRLRRKMSQ